MNDVVRMIAKRDVLEDAATTACSQNVCPGVDPDRAAGGSPPPRPPANPLRLGQIKHMGMDDFDREVLNN